MWMSSIGWNSRSKPAGQGTSAPSCADTRSPASSTQGGFTRRRSMPGTASFSALCLSLMEAELSTTNRRSILSTDW
jgi:hypothetical protein